jgi:hypothetical protein
MKNIEQIKLNERQIALLADFYESEAYKVIVDVLIQRQDNHAKQNLAASTTLDQLNQARGRALEDRWIYEFVRRVYKERKQAEIEKNKAEAAANEEVLNS